ncbi:MAG: TetR/AcrR family transcriptional regulator [Planctomycetota bacterium]
MPKRSADRTSQSDGTTSSRAHNADTPTDPAVGDANGGERARRTATGDDTPTPPPKKGSKKRTSVRDRKRTEHEIVSAVGAVLARDGFRGIGVNALAREAGVDKVLIYRYFGGLEQAIEAYAREVEFWPTADELAGYDDAVASAPIIDQLITYLRNLARALQRRPTTLEVLAWEVSERNDLTRQLDTARRAVTAEFFERFVTLNADDPRSRAIRDPFDLVALGVIAAVLRGHRADQDGSPGVGITPVDGDWSSLDAAIEIAVRGILTQGSIEPNPQG